MSPCWLSATPWTAALQVPVSSTISWSLLRFMSIELVMLSNHFIISRRLLLLPSLFPRIRVFSNKSVLRIRWPKYWSFNISPYNDIQGWFSLGLTGLISLPSKGRSSVFSSTTVQRHQFFGAQPSLPSNSHIHTTGKTIAVTIWTFVSKVMSLLFNTLSRFSQSFLSKKQAIIFQLKKKN